MALITCWRMLVRDEPIAASAFAGPQCAQLLHRAIGGLGIGGGNGLLRLGAVDFGDGNRQRCWVC